MKKKILHIQVIPKLSGVQKVSLEIFKGLPNKDYEKWILFSDSTDAGDKEACKKAFEDSGAKILYTKNLHRAIGKSDFSALWEIYTLCKKERFDIVHTHSTKPGIIGRIAATLAGTPLVIHTVHGLSFHHFVKFPVWQFYWMCEMFASLFCDHIVMVNRYYKKYFKWYRKKHSVIYNGIDYTIYSTVPQKLKTNNEINILSVGRLDTPKDPITLLRAAKIVLEKNQSVRFTLVGDGEKYQDCLDFIEANHLTSFITLAGWQNDVSHYYATADIFTLSSIYESFGLIFLEAGYFELPVVSTNVEGIPEVVADGETGILCNPRDSEALAQNILKLVNNPGLRLQLGKKGKQRVTSLFTQQRMVSSYLAIYESNY